MKLIWLQSACPGKTTFFSHSNLCRFIHIPGKVDPTTIVENNKKRIAQLRILHNREAAQVPAMEKGSF